MQKAMLIHNPRCSKSRSAKEILEERSIDFDTLDYLSVGLNEDLLLKLPSLLHLPFEKMIRNKEEVFIELNLKDKKLSDGEWVKILLAHPILLERPIFIKDDKAVIARPPELLIDLL